MIAKEDDIFRKNVCRLVSFVYKKANMKNLIVGVSEGVFIDVEVFPNPVFCLATKTPTTAKTLQKVIAL